MSAVVEPVAMIERLGENIWCRSVRNIIRTYNRSPNELFAYQSMAIEIPHAGPIESANQAEDRSAI